MTTGLSPNGVLAELEQKATIGSAYQSYSLGRTDRRGRPVRSNGIGVNAQGYGYFSYFYYFGDECGSEVHDVSRSEALAIIAEVRDNRDPARREANRAARLLALDARSEARR